MQAWWSRIARSNDPETLDDGTWADLEMPAVFHWLDRTLTAVGSQILYAWLRSPDPTLERGTRRRELARSVGEPSLRPKLQAILLDLGDHVGWDLGDLLASELPRPRGPRWVYELLGRVALPGLALAFASGQWWLIFAAVGIAVGNAVIHMTTARKTSGHLDALRALRAVIGTAHKAWALLPENAREAFGDLEPCIEQCRRRFSGRGLSDAAALPPGSLQETAAEYHRTFVLTQVRAYARVVDDINAHRDAYLRVVDFVGQLDAALGLAHLLEHSATLTEPQLLPDAEARLRASGVVHPRIDDPVANDAALGPRSLLVTGSNMAGKSTFLRTLGINVVVAQALGVAFAESFAASEMRVVSSMHAKDDLEESTSLYQAEVERVLELIRAGRSNRPCLMLLDEVFRGTNPSDRIAASASVLLDLAEHNLVVAASHDLQLAEMTAEAFDVAHFTEHVGDGGVVFDYRLHPGISVRTNALDLLERLGYPAPVVERARGFARGIAPAG